MNNDVPGAPDPPEPGRTGLAFLPPSARAREHQHRRALLLGIAALLLLSLSPVIGRHLFGAAHKPLTGIDHVGAVCLVALHLLLAPVHAGLHVLVGAGLGYAAWDRVRAWRGARRWLGPLDGTVPAPGDPFWVAATAAGLPPDRLRVVGGLPVPAFTARWRAPLVYAARELADGPRRLAPGELAAVLAHERAHLERRDPLRFSLLRAMASTLFWIPALRGLADDVADEAEVQADDRAAAATDPLTLASALVSLAAWRAPGPGAPGGPRGDSAVGLAVGFVRPDLLERRVRRLAGEDTTPASRVTRRSLAGAALALVVVWASGIVDVHALPHDALPPDAAAHALPPVVDPLHCHHLRGGPFTHLFCRHGAPGGWITRGGSHCPHRRGAPPGAPVAAAAAATAGVTAVR